MAGVNEREITLLEGHKKRESIMSKALQKLQSAKADQSEGMKGLMHVSRLNGVKIALFGENFYFSMDSINKQRKTTKIVQLASLANVRKFYLSEIPKEAMDGVWFLEVDDPKRGHVTYKFKSKTEFEATGWLQVLRMNLNSKKDPFVPVVVALGETGSGKSLLCSRLSGLSAENERFIVSDSIESATLQTSMYRTRWLGNPKMDKVIIVDTPGLSDTRQNDQQNIDQMLKRLDEIGYINTFCVVFNSEQDRFDDGLVQMLRTFERHFGPVFWKHCMIVFSRWFMDPAALKRRKRTKDQLAHEWNQALKTRFPNILKIPQVRKEIRCYFVDSDPSLEGSEFDEANGELLAFQSSAKQNLRFDCRSNIPDPDSLLAVTKEFPDAAPSTEPEEIFEVLRLLRLGHRVPRLLENGVTSFEQLSRIPKSTLRKVFHWTPAEVRRLQLTRAPIEPSSPPEVLLKDLLEMGLPVEKIDEAGIGTREMLRMDYEDISRKFNFNWGDHYEAYRKWRDNVMEGQVVTDEILWTGAIVVRNSIAWGFDDDRRPQDFYGPGYVINWTTKDGESKGNFRRPDDWNGSKRAFQAPLPGYARVYWLNTGYTNTYCIDPEKGCDCKFEDPDEFKITKVDADDPSKCEIALGELPDKIGLRELHCTFAYPKGLKTPHWAKFDIREEICNKFGGEGLKLKHGDVVSRDTEDDQFKAVCIGVGVSDAGEPNLYFEPLGRAAEGCGTLSSYTDNLIKMASENVEERHHSEFECHSDGGIENDVLEDLEEDLEESFRFPVGRRFPTNATFDIRDEIIDRFERGLRHGTVLVHKYTKREFVVVGISKHESDRARLWVKDSNNRGATVWPFLFKDINSFNIQDGLQPLEEDVVEDEFVPPTEEELRALELELTFEFPRGAGAYTKLRKFDIRDEVVKKLCGFTSGEVFTREGVDQELTVIGVCNDPDTKLPVAWFHPSDYSGAIMVPNFHLFVSNKTYKHTGATNDLNDLKKALKDASRRPQTRRDPAPIIDPNNPENVAITPLDDPDGPKNENEFFRWLKLQTQ
ncbi:AIG1 family protein [Durusdinium trenchii]|uniref:AIG1 family protein n=1 Tax=Durusdinium trenchii TaxID=1381693 RepID=A0ABP0SET7_9DINO